MGGFQSPTHRNLPRILTPMTMTMLRTVVLVGAAAALLCGCNREPTAEYEYKLPGGYSVFKTSSDDIMVRCMASERYPDIPAKVVGLGWNERFILAKQQTLTNRASFPGDTFQIPVAGKYQFWIIDLTTTNRIGPLDENEFTEKTKALGVAAIKMKPPGAFAK